MSATSLAREEYILQRLALQWVNEVLVRWPRATSLHNDFANGARLIALAEALTDRPVVGYIANPRMLLDKLSNVRTAVFHLEQAWRVTVVGVSPDDVVRGNASHILQLIAFLAITVSPFHKFVDRVLSALLERKRNFIFILFLFILKKYTDREQPPRMQGIHDRDHDEACCRAAAHGVEQKAAPQGERVCNRTTQTAAGPACRRGSVVGIFLCVAAAGWTTPRVLVGRIDRSDVRGEKCCCCHRHSCFLFLCRVSDAAAHRVHATFPSIASICGRKRGSGRH